MPHQTIPFSPHTLDFVFLSFEGPDQPYSQAGGLGVRVTHLTRTLARHGFETHLIFVGDPSLPGKELREDGHLHLYRWCQWISSYHPSGVYAAEAEKTSDYQNSVPGFVTQTIIKPAVAAGRRIAVIAEEWHTAKTLIRLSDSLHSSGIRDTSVLLWNANNDMSFDRINWKRLDSAAAFGTVSRYVKAQMRNEGVEPLLIPNGIPENLLNPVPSEDVAVLRKAMGPSPWFFKIGRMDPDKGWLPAIEAVNRLRKTGHRARLVIKSGDRSEHGSEVYDLMSRFGLNRTNLRTDDRSTGGIATALRAADPDSAVLNLDFFLPDSTLPVLYAASNGVLANSSYEPFGLVGLETMAAGGIAYVGSTGEDYALSLRNCIALDSSNDPEELVQAIMLLHRDAALEAQIRSHARMTAQLHTWDVVIPILLEKLRLAAGRQRMRGLSHQTPSAPQ